MASVYLACRLGPGEGPRVVAIKKMFESFAKQPEFVTMFLDEAHIAARMRHPNVVTTYEFLRIPDSLAIVMDFVLGVSLVDLTRIARDQKAIAPLGVTAAILRDALLGLHAAHEATDDHGKPFGLVHRDVSPHNIIVGKDGAARVIDFGIAKAAGRLQVTEVGVMKGKFAYMAPEQIRAGTVDRRVDVYSAGIVLWEALTGMPLFRGSADAEMFSKRAAGMVVSPPPSSVNPELSPSVDELVGRALAVDPNERFATALDLADALGLILPLASQQEVSQWVHGLAGSRLRELEAKRNEVETAHASGELAGLLLRSPSSPELPPHVVHAPTPPAPDFPAPELDIPKPVPRAAPSKPAGRGSGPALPPPRRPSPSSAPQDRDDAFADTEAVHLNLELAAPPMARAPVAVVSTRRLPAAARRVQSAPERGWGRAVLLTLVLIALAASGVVLEGPSFLKARVVAGAAKRGLVLSVGSLEPRAGGVTLSDVTIGLKDVPGVAMKAAVVDLDVTWQGTVRKIVVPGYELTVHGAASEVAKGFAAWRASPRVPLAFEASAGHVLWSDMLVRGVQLEGLDVSMVIGTHDETSLLVDTPSVSLTLGRGTLGPWRAHVDSALEETKVTVSLDRARPDAPPSLSLLARESLGTLVTATVPRTKVAQIGVPAELVRAGSDPELELALEVHVMPSGEPVTAHATLSLFGIPTGSTSPAAPPVDLILDGAIGGDTSKPLPIDPGTLQLGKVKTRLTGSVKIAADGIRVEVERPVPRASSPLPPFVLDTREWTSARDATPQPKPAPTPSAAPPPSGAKRR